MTNKQDIEKNTPVKKTDVVIQPVSITDSAKNGSENPNDERAEIGGRKGPEPTRYGDWEKNGRCIDF